MSCAGAPTHRQSRRPDAGAAIRPGTTDILSHVNRLLGYDFTPHLAATPASLESPFYRLTVDAASGGLASLVSDLRAKVEREAA